MLNKNKVPALFFVIYCDQITKRYNFPYRKLFPFQGLSSVRLKNNFMIFMVLDEQNVGLK